MTAGTIAQIVGWILAPVCSGLIVALFATVRKLRDERARAKTEEAEIERATREITKALGRWLIFEAYEKYIISNEKLSIARYEEICRTFDAYKALGGNGTAKAYMEEITARRPYLVTD